MLAEKEKPLSAQQQDRLSKAVTKLEAAFNKLGETITSYDSLDLTLKNMIPSCVVQRANTNKDAAEAELQAARLAIAAGKGNAAETLKIINSAKELCGSSASQIKNNIAEATAAQIELLRFGGA